MRKILLLGSLAAALLVPALPAWAAGASAPEAQGYTEGGPKLCLGCHDDAKVAEILLTPHAVKGDSHSPFGQHGCESCHGPGDEHTQNRFNPPPVVMKKGPRQSSVEARNEKCLSCHQAGLRMNWQGSQHANNDVACNDCHRVHVRKDPVMVKLTQPAVCFTCHPEQRADSYKFSHHPIREAKVVCSDCHNPMGSPGPKLLKEVTVNETCYNCHPERRGPFLWEHTPVRDSCLNCHTPHGSTQPRLLKMRPSFLCQECHGLSTHQSGIFSGAQLPQPTPGNPSGVQTLRNPLTGTYGALTNFRAFGRGCENCHSNIHGSNSPAGMFFTR